MEILLEVGEKWSFGTLVSDFYLPETGERIPAKMYSFEFKREGKTCLIEFKIGETGYAIALNKVVAEEVMNFCHSIAVSIFLADVQGTEFCLES